MSIPHLSETTLRRQATAQSFQRGESYYQCGAVGHLQQRGNTLQAEVEGSEVEPYTVCLTFDDSGLTAADCSCPYSFEGWCKHIVATALACLRQPESIEERPTLQALLERLDLPQTRGLVREMVAEQPRLMETVDDYVQRLAEPIPSQQPATPPRRTLVDPAPYRRAMQQILRGAVRDWESGRDDDSISYELQAVIDKAQDFTAHGDAPNALVALEAITRACVDHWEEVAEYGAESNDVVAALDQAWTEAILSTEWTPTEKTALQQHLTGWQDELGGSFAMSLASVSDPADGTSRAQVQADGNVEATRFGVTRRRIISENPEYSPAQGQGAGKSAFIEAELSRDMPHPRHRGGHREWVFPVVLQQVSPYI